MVKTDMRMTNVIVNEKGNVKAEARKAIVAYVDTHRNVFADAVKNDNGTYSVAVVDGAGNTVYVNFDVTVSTKNAADRAEKKSTRKVKEAEAFDIEG
jgi:chloramphenicol 3-O-phosphotransferase